MVPRSVLTVCIFAAFSILAISCSLTSNENKNDQLLKAGGEGYVLAKKYCATCHSFVPAGMLDKATWSTKVLPGMAPHLGIGVFGETDYINNPNYGSGVISFENWMKVVDYYTSNAPAALSAAVHSEKVVKDWGIFKMKKPSSRMYPEAKTMVVSFDTSAKMLYTSDGYTKFIYRRNRLLQMTDSVYVSSPAVSAAFYNGADGTRKAVFSTLGTMRANDISEGLLLQFNTAQKFVAVKDTIAKDLPRPVQSVPCDLNNDGVTDWVVCGFGHNKGALYWLQALPQGGFRKHSIVSVPGAIQAIVQDFNHDGWMDMMVLFAHDDESIRLFTNDHNGSFTVTRILTFPPVNGSSSFQLVDFNKDGLMDILYACGDNADLSPILKPFHGIYIYLNKGKAGYQQAYFYPINGCTKAVAADFDKDGDLDIVTIAFFADFKNNPSEKFLYFEQDNALHFVPHAPPIEKNGRWLCMDVTDIDGDGDLDVILGNFARGLNILKNFVPNWDLNTPFIVLENSIARRP